MDEDLVPDAVNLVEDEDSMELESTYWNNETEEEVESQIDISVNPNAPISWNTTTTGSMECEDSGESKNAGLIGGNNANNEELTLATSSNYEDNTGDCSQSKALETTIKAIDRNVVHQICSGQVIVTLSTAVKELVENAVDAGATSVEIRLVEYGSKLIEVIDSGCGVTESNFEGLALKHHTSKISEFEDLASVATFGFRGEALSSLCALSDLTVITRSKALKAKTGFKIEYNSRGKITSKAACARECGTTVILKNLFQPLPVRHREFMKNLKKEFHKMVNTLYGYCLIASGVRITCTNQVGSGAPSKIISVPACPTMRERIAAIFGSKQLQSLMEFQQEDDISEEILADFGLTRKTLTAGNYSIEGYVSVPNRGRSSNDRQFFFINSRPCDPSKISRIVNEAYHGYSRSQSPFVCLNIKTRRENVDVNVTPDKRTLYLQSEKSLYALLKASLTSMYLTESSTFNLSAGQEMLAFSQSESQYSQPKLKFGSSSQSPSNSLKIESVGNDTSFASQFSSSKFGSKRGESSSSSTIRTRSFLQNFAHKSSSLRSSSKDTKSLLPESDQFFHPYKREPSSSGNRKGPSSQPKLWDFVSDSPKSQASFKQTENNSDSDIEILEHEELNKTQDSESTTYFPSQDAGESKDDIQEMYDDELENGLVFEKGPSTNVNINWEEIKTRLQSSEQMNLKQMDKNYARRFRAKIAPGENETAEQELKKQLTKEMFMKMKIIGQFNLGFITVKCGPDVFIVDQHASDEKYNFEDLEKMTIMQSQKLIRPMELQLPAVSENVIMDNLDVFQKNGFDFDIDPEGEPTKRVKLSTIPYSKSCEFGKSDVDELIFMLEDAPEKCFCRPSKVRMMLASRACRKSVMIGTALSCTEMRKIVDHMGEMNQPWNCPHGRPTIRHLINLNLLPDIDLEMFNH